MPHSGHGASFPREAQRLDDSCVTCLPELEVSLEFPGAVASCPGNTKDHNDSFATRLVNGEQINRLRFPVPIAVPEV